MDWFTSLLDNLFFRGLLVGLLVAIIVWFRSVLKSRHLHAEIKKLRDHLHTKFELESEDNERRKAELTKITAERDNLRNMIQVLNQKPGKQELRHAQVLHRATEIMFEKSPGFAPAWQATLKEAEEEIRNAEKGFIPFIKRMTGSGSHSNAEQKSKKRLELEEPED